MHKISGENVNTMRHSIDEIDEFEEAVVSKPALSPEMMMVGGNELVEADQESGFVLEQIDDLEFETARTQALVVGLLESLDEKERASV